jgi:hypothetical protein
MTHRASYLVSLGEPNVYHESVCFTRIGDFTWRVSDCDELVGLLTGDEGIGNAFNKSPQSTFQILPASQSSDSTTKI